ncbi:MAG: hypothetical protein V3R81_02105 [Gammaproteobacteria bacterium]
MRRLTLSLLLLLFSSLVSGGGVLTKQVGPSLGVVTLTNFSANCTDFGPSSNDCTAGVRVSGSGTIDKNIDGGYTQQNAATDWIIANSQATIATFYIRATEISYVENETGTLLFGTRSGPMTTWETLGKGVSREWSLRSQTNTAGSGNITWVIDIEIATDSAGTNILEIGRYTITGEVG